MNWKDFENSILEITYFSIFYCIYIISNVKLIQLGHMLLIAIHPPQLFIAHTFFMFQLCWTGLSISSTDASDGITVTQFSRTWSILNRSKLLGIKEKV